MSALKTYFEIVISFRPFMDHLPNEIIEEKAKELAKNLPNAEVREVAE